MLNELQIPTTSVQKLGRTRQTENNSRVAHRVTRETKTLCFDKLDKTQLNTLGSYSSSITPIQTFIKN